MNAVGGIFMSVAVALIAGLLLTRLTSIWKLPDVTAYLVAGILIGPSCIGALGISGLGFASAEMIGKVSFISNSALGFIAFAIGNEFSLDKLRHTGRAATIIGILQALVTTVVVDAVLLLLHLIAGDEITVPEAIVLGAMATATAPAATLMVVRQYKAKGKLTDILLPVVALDDAVGLAVFSVSFGIANAIGGGELNLMTIIVKPFMEILMSLALGAAAGAVLTFLEKYFHSNRNRISLIISFVLLTAATSSVKIPFFGVELEFSLLLVCMMLGTVFCNLCPLADELMDRADAWTAPLMALFFTMSGAQLEFSVFKDIIVVGIGFAYILSRCAGKYFGARWSAKLAGCDESIQKHLGITLFPQAGVALGMCLVVDAAWGAGTKVKNIVLFGILIYELIGPLLTKIALTKAGDIQPKSPEVENRRAMKLEAKGKQ